MKATEIVEKLKSVLLSSDTAEVVQEEVNETEVTEPTELAYEDKEGMEEEMPSEEVADDSEEMKYATKEELEAAVAEMKAMYQQIMDQMGSGEMEVEVPQELSKQEPVELSAESPVEPIAHTPEVEAAVRPNIRLAQNRPMSTLDRVFAQLNQIKK
jgi:hypothetical protein